MASSLNVTIIGGSLSGLAATRAMREHHKVTAIERWEGGHEVGAAVKMGPTGTAWLDTVGFDRRKAVSIHATILQSFSRNGNLIAEVDRSQFQRNSKGDWLFLHGADLFNELLRMATAPSEELGISGKLVQIRWSTDVIDVDVESEKVTLAGSETIESDLVVGADGIKSIVRPLVVGEAAFHTARPSGLSAF